MSPAVIEKLWTIGHSTRSWEEFLALLVDAQIETLVDVRRFAGSRRNPQFSGAVMGAALARASIVYVPMPALGGRRPTHARSHNLAWRSAGLRGYADYMETAAYQQARQQLVETAQSRRTSVMCAEALWWQCHRSLISDDFKARGWEVVHLLSRARQELHPYTSAARIVDGQLDYTLPVDPLPASPQQSLF
ncbi:MAG: DUF488 domain-containing protein [Pseudoxanthomonas sp.]